MKRATPFFHRTAIAVPQAATVVTEKAKGITSIELETLPYDAGVSVSYNPSTGVVKLGIPGHRPEFDMDRILTMDGEVLCLGGNILWN
jgi:hypothetical protein